MSDTAPTMPGEERAVFSPCSRYRYRLRRLWLLGAGRVVWVMLNPSTADAVKNDPTIERCTRFAQRWGYRELEVVNIFAFRSTDPAGLLTLADPVGPENDRHIVEAVLGADRVVAAWGKHGAYMDRGAKVAAMLAGECRLVALAVNADGSPRHPLYIPYTAIPMDYSHPTPRTPA